MTLLSTGAAGETLEWTIHPDKVLNRVDPKIYGHFYEHIYHSVHGGLWGDIVWNRSLEVLDPYDALIEKEGEILTQKNLGYGPYMAWGDSGWTDYEVHLEARKEHGAEGFLILLRNSGQGQFYWVNIGGFGNTLHILEKSRSPQNRKQIWETEAKGHIEPGCWYDLRFRCEGPRIQFWLDGALIIDYTDPQAPWLEGGIGFGTWFTCSSIRNVTVKTLDGTPLFQGLPDVSEQNVMAEHWEAWGAIQCGLVREDPLNGSNALRLGPGGAGGVRQKNIHSMGSRIVEGTVWLRSDRDKFCSIRIREGEETLAEQKIKAKGPCWKETPLRFELSRPCQEGVLELETRGPGELFVDQLSLMPQAARENKGFRPDLYKALKGLRPPVIRWPGGCYAERYRWKDGIGPQYKRGTFPYRLWDDQDPNALGTDEFMELCEMLGAEPVIVLNGGRYDQEGLSREDYIQEACDWLSYCNSPSDTYWGKERARNGHPEPYNVRYWEIDNESWPIGVDAYAELVGDFVPALKSIDPEIEIIACGSPGMDTAWNQQILDRCAPLIDILSIHHYDAPENFQKGPGQYEAFIAGEAEKIRQSENPEIQIYVSEWNAQSTDWRTGLWAAQMLNGFERLGHVVTMTGPALLMRHLSATEWDNAFINFNHLGWFPAPNYVIMQLWHDAYGSERIAIQGDMEKVDALAVRGEEGSVIYVKMANAWEEAHTIHLGLPEKWQGAKAEWQEVAPGSLEARNTLENPYQVQPQRGTVHRETEGYSLTLPPLSAGVLKIQAD